MNININFDLIKKAKEVSENMAEYEIVEKALMQYIEGKIHADELKKSDKKAEEDLKESEETYRSLVEFFPDAVAIHQDGIVVYVNQAAIKLMEVNSLNDIIGLKAIEFVHPVYREMALERIKKSSTSGEIAPLIEEVFITLKGNKLFCEVSSLPIKYNNKTAMLVVFRDISERKKLEDEIKENENKYRTLFNTLTEGVAVNEIIYNDAGEMIDYRILEINDAYLNLTGIKREQIIGNTATTLYSMTEEFIKSFWYYHKDHTTTIYSELESPAESEKFFFISTSPIINNKFLTTFFDITERKKIEKEYREGEEKYRTLFEEAIDAIFVADTESGIIVDCNQAAENLLKMEKNEIIGKHQKSIHPIEEIDGDFNIAFKEHITSVASKIIESKIITKDDQIKTVSIKASIFELKGKKLIQGIFRDITETRKAERALKENEELLRELADNIPAFIAVVDAETLKYKFANKRFQKGFSKTKEEIIGNHISKVIGEKNTAYAMEYINKVRNGNSASYINTFKLTEGNRYISVNYVPKFDEYQRVKEILVLSYDITDIKQAEQALLESEKKYHAFFESSPIPIWEEDFSNVKKYFDKLNMKGIADYRKYFHENNKALMECASLVKIIDINTEGRKIFEVSTKEEIVRNLPVYFTEESWPVFLEEIAALAEGKTRFDSEIKINDLKGGQKILYLHLIVLAGAEETLSRVLVSFVDITERKNNEILIKENERRLRKAQVMAHVGNWELDLKTGKVWASEEAFAIYGIERETPYLQLEFVQKLVFPQYRSLLDTAMKNLIRNNDPYDQEFEITRYIDNELRFIHSKAELFRNSDGVPVKVLGVIQDITERKKAEEALEQKILALTQPLGDTSNLKFEDLFNLEDVQKIQDAFAEGTGVASIITDVEGKPITSPSNFCYLCEHLIRKTGQGLTNCYKSDAVIGRKNPDGPIIQRCLSGGLWDAGASICIGDRHIANWLIGQVLDDSIDREEMVKYSSAIGVDESVFREALKHVTTMSIEKFTSISNALYLIAKQLSLLALQNIQQAREIKNREQAEIELQKERDHLHNYLNIVNVMVIVLDTKANIIMINKKGCEILGYEKHEIIDRNWFDVALPQDKRMELSSVFQKIVSGDLESVEHYENPVLTKSGEQRIIAFNNSFLRDKTQKIYCVISSGQDITDDKKAEEEHLRLQNLESLGVLAGGIAHDFNNILGTILGRASIALDDIQDENVRNDILAIEKASKRAVGLTQQLLTFAKGGTPEKRIINLRKIIQETTNFSLSGSNILVEYNFNDSISIEADPGQIAQVIQNLVINAKQAMPRGGKITITTENYEDNQNKLFIEISIEDSGMGIPKEHQIKIFDPYFTTKQSGSGLGLSVSYSIVNRHEGKIYVNSELGKGTVFTILLPACITAPEKKENKDAVLTDKLNILIMDDEEDIRALLSSLLLRLGHTVSVSKDGDEALRMYKESKEREYVYDLVFMDLTVRGGMGGKECVKLLKNYDPSAKVVVSSGYADSSLSNYKTDGFDGMLKKPYSKSELKEVIFTVINS